jgi:hypothetical protein
VASLVLFFFRRIVQDGEHVHFREETPEVPDATEAALLGAAVAPPSATPTSTAAMAQ